MRDYPTQIGRPTLNMDSAMGWHLELHKKRQLAGHSLMRGLHDCGDIVTRCHKLLPRWSSGPWNCERKVNHPPLSRFCQICCHGSKIITSPGCNEIFLHLFQIPRKPAAPPNSTPYTRMLFLSQKGWALAGGHSKQRD